MTDSYRTGPPDRIARRRQPKADGGDPKLPRLVERRPYPGDIHPLPKRVLQAVLPQISRKYWHGLTRVELRARKGAVGEPFAYYAPDQKLIVLYSLPTTWELDHITEWLRFSLRAYQGEAKANSAGFSVTWESDAVMGLWFLHTVFAYELGHHFDNRYRTRRKLTRGMAYEEIVADLHAMRIERALSREWAERRVGDA